MQGSVDLRQHELSQRSRQHQRDQHIDQGLAHELDDQVAPPGADRLAHPDLYGPAARPGGHQGHEVDGGDGDDQQSHGGDAGIHLGIDGRTQHVRSHADVREVDPVDRHQAEAERRRAVLRRIVASSERREPASQRFRPNPGPELHIGQLADVVGRSVPFFDRHGRKRRPAGSEDLDVQVGVGREVLEHRHHPHGMEAGDQGLLGWRIAQGRVFGRVDQHRAADRGVDTEVLAGRLAGQDQPVRRLQGSVGISGQHRIGHDPEEVRRDPDRGLRSGDIPALQERTAGAEAGDVFHLWERQLQGARQDAAGEDHRPGLLAGQGRVGLQSIGALVARQKALESVFVAQIEADHDRRGKADRQAQDGDAGIEPVAGEVAQRGREIVAEHDPYSPIIRI